MTFQRREIDYEIDYGQKRLENTKYPEKKLL